MNTGNPIRRARMQGFSLLELLVVVAILTLVMGAIFQQVNQVQKRYRTEESKLDVSQESREFLDQIIRDVRQAGYPGPKMYQPTPLPGALLSPWQNDARAAAGLVSFSYTDLWFEADVDGDGQVESVRYTLQPGPGNTCPCRLRRSQVPKLNATAPMAQFTSYSTGLNDVINSAGAGGGGVLGAYTIAGSTPMAGGMTPNDVIYRNLEGAYVFTAFDVNGNQVAPCDINSNPGQLATIKTIGVTLNVLVKPGGADLQTRMRPAISINASAKLSN